MITVLLRFGKLDEPEALKAAVEQNAALAGKKQGKLAAVGADFLRWEWKYSLTKPKAEDVARLAGALHEAIKPLAPRFNGRCEKCHSASTSDLTLLNGLPMYICSGCQQRIHQELDQAAMNYAALQPNYVNGTALGGLAAALGAVAWGVVAYGLHRIFLYGAILIGYFIAWGVLKGTRKVTLVGQVTIPILTVASVLLGDAIFFTLSVMNHDHVPFSQKLFLAIVTNLWEIEKQAKSIASIIFALIGAAYALYRARRPKFKAVFEPLGIPGA